MHIRLVIFDFDGTLGDTRDNIVKIMQRTMLECGLPVADEKACAGTIGLMLDKCFQQLYPWITAEAANDYAAQYRRIYAAEKSLLVPKAFPHVRETLDWLLANNYIAAIASSRTSASLRELLGAMGIAPYFSCIVGGEDVACPKPDPEAVQKIMSAHDMVPEQTMIVGDMPVDMKMGCNGGTHTCAVTYGNSNRGALEDAGAEHVIDGIGELIGVLESYSFGSGRNAQGKGM